MIEHCLNNQRDAYKSRQRLLTLATYLRIEGNNNKLREGKVLELVAKKAFEVRYIHLFYKHTYIHVYIHIYTCKIPNQYFGRWKQKLIYHFLLYRLKIIIFVLQYAHN